MGSYTVEESRKAFIKARAPARFDVKEKIKLASQ